MISVQKSIKKKSNGIIKNKNLSGAKFLNLDEDTLLACITQAIEEESKQKDKSPSLFEKHIEERIETGSVRKQEILKEPLLEYENIDSTVKGSVFKKVWSWSDGMEVKIPVQNIVYTTNLGININLTYLSMAFARFGAQFCRKGFAALVCRALKPKIAILVFTQGKIVCAGAKSQGEALFMLGWFKSQLRDVGYEDIINNPLKLQNMVVSFSVPYKIDILSLSQQYNGMVSYKKILFPGAIMRHPVDLKISELIFQMGKINITGLKSQSNLEAVLNQIMPIIKKFKTR
jgi:transcription initiation factor TFIID TATA-box-binding protein